MKHWKSSNDYNKVSSDTKDKRNNVKLNNAKEKINEWIKPTKTAMNKKEIE